jgi:tRNA/tmRNA/rRNA uracil-C5-methylase (TrmA/RlmC/RlmD family)
VLWKVRHGEGTVDRWVTRDRRRVQAVCPVAATCGGCDLWEAGTALGDLKQLMVQDLFSRQLPETPEWRWSPAPASARRHRIQLHWDGHALGFHQRRSHQVVPVDQCPAAAKVLSQAIPRLQEALQGKILPTKPQRWELATGTPAGAVFATLESHRTWQLEPDGWHAWEGPILHDHGAFRLQHRAGGFYQVSPEWAAEAFGALLREWDVRGGRLYDLFGGVGFFSALLGDRFQQRCLVEFDEAAVAWARRNLEALGLAAECITADAAAWVPGQLGEAGDLLLLDPPRAGLAPELCERLQTARCGTMVLVGCDGAAFCRDVKRLAPAWKLEALAALDLFPFTHHVECVALLRRVGPRTD